MHKAIFLDRDGTINEDIGDLYVPEKLIFIPRALEALRLLQERFLLFIITNQSGIERKIFSEDEFQYFNDYFNLFLKNEGITIKHIYYCPHTKETDCRCRKPHPYFLKQAANEHAVDLKSSFVLGDHPSDIEMAHKAGAGSVYLLTGHGKKHRHELLAEPDFIANGIYEASMWITGI